jgi:hypothetical protein
MNDKIDELERRVMICECHSLEHQVVFWYDSEFGDLYCEPHLTTHRNFFQRMWAGIKYTFGHRSKYGEWDSTIFKTDDLIKLRVFLDDRAEKGRK